MENEKRQFHHSIASRVGLAGTTFASGWVALTFFRFDIEGVVRFMSLFPFLLFVFSAYRLYLTLRSVRIEGDRVDLVHPWGLRTFTLSGIKAIRFDSYPNDLIVDHGERSYRLPRTLQGFQKLHEFLIARTHLSEHESLPVEVRVRRSLRYATMLALVFQAAIGLLVARQGVTAFATIFCVSMLVAAGVFLDQYLLRRCVFQADGLWVHGLFGRRFYPHAALVDTEVKKTNLWTRMKLNFGKGTVTLEDQVLDLPMVRLARIVEHEWGHSVHGTNTPAKSS